MTRSTRIWVASVAIAALGAIPTAARAQVPTPSLTNNQPFAAPHEGQDGPKPRQELPPAVPGAQSKAGSAAPLRGEPTDMSPNDALFDAINRGDIAAAKDAINRGADLFARNILGMTPTDLSIDLGRNDITFLLLSLRPAALAELPPAQQRRPPPGKNPPAVRNVSATGRTTDRSAGRVTAAREHSAGSAPPAGHPAVPPLAPRQFAGDGGAPAPQAGFLGFGSVTR